MKRRALLLLLLVLLALPLFSLPERPSVTPPTAPTSFTINVKNADSWSIPIKIAVLLTFLSLLPTILIVLTAFTRIVISFHFLRQAMGSGETPPNQVIVGLSLFLTLFVMTPTFNAIYQEAYVPYEQGKINETEALNKSAGPLKTFMLGQTREKDLEFMINLSKSPRPKNRSEVGLTVLIPSFILSEIKTGFEIGFLIYIPFLIIDIVVASILVSLGMVFLPPVMVSLPFKVILFIIADGWTLLIGALVKSFGG